MVLAGTYELWAPERPRCFDAQALPGGTEGLDANCIKQLGRSCRLQLNLRAAS